jgi:hypothetical protein
MKRQICWLCLVGLGWAQTEWPNSASQANSDPWLVEHAQQLRVMRPRILVLNFCNDVPRPEVEKKVSKLAHALDEGSRYHARTQPQNPAFLQHQIVAIVDLTDSNPSQGRTDGNSSWLPLKELKDNGHRDLDTSQYYSARFAQKFGFRKPGGGFYKLDELIDRGKVHELWCVTSDHTRDIDQMPECMEVKQVYDEQFRPIAGKWVQAGNGDNRWQPWTGRSFRILDFNAGRGPGCAMESLSHAIEGTARSRAIPYFTKYFFRFAGFDLDKRFSVPFDSLYAGIKDPVVYPDKDTAVVRRDGRDYRIHPYVCAGGNVHFCPNAHSHYDLKSQDRVMSTVEHFAMRDGPGGSDRAELWSLEMLSSTRELLDDCMGPWLVYWRQNFPGWRNRALDDDGQPMRNWWPFLYF